MTNVDLGRYKRIVQYFWDPEPTNNEGSKLPIWCLGHQYTVPTKSDLSTSPHTLPLENTSQALETRQQAQTVTPPDSTSSSLDSNLAYDESTSSNGEDGGWPTPFLDDFESRIWLTYRSNFPAIPRSQDPQASAAMTFSVRLRSQLVDHNGFTSDTGWGCMIRSGQSLLANAVAVLRLGRDWKRGALKAEEQKILSLFADDPKAPYSIHKFVEHGAAACGKHPGEWFGPSATARCIQALVNGQGDSDLRVYVTGDGSDVYEDSFMSIAKPTGTTFTPTLILVGTRLGIDKITPVYWEALKSSLQMPQSIGIAGGRPSASHYFVGVQGSQFFYLDPHHTRHALPLLPSKEGYSASDVDSCHTRRLRRLHVKEMDPSMLIGFLIRDEDDWRKWRQAVNYVQGKAVIHIGDTDPALHELGAERAGAIDEVETFDDSDDDDDVTVQND